MTATSADTPRPPVRNAPTSPTGPGNAPASSHAERHPTAPMGHGAGEGQKGMSREGPA
jgi:hypothetical protein